MIREAKGNMYEFVSHTWNPIKESAITAVAIVIWINCLPNGRSQIGCWRISKCLFGQW